MAYGYSERSSRRTVLGFNGERLAVELASYLLGNGYRAFSPVLMRFLSPDNFSPFGEGGSNSYVYCLNDPVNQRDPDGHAGEAFIRNASTRIAFRKPSKNPPSPQRLMKQYNKLGNQIVANTIANNSGANQTLHQQQLAIARSLASSAFQHLPKRQKIALGNLRVPETPMIDALQNPADPFPPMLQSVDNVDGVRNPAPPVQTTARLRGAGDVVQDRRAFVGAGLPAKRPAQVANYLG